jgi:hypothetical protein
MLACCVDKTIKGKAMLACCVGSVSKRSMHAALHAALAPLARDHLMLACCVGSVSKRSKEKQRLHQQPRLQEQNRAKQVFAFPLISRVFAFPLSCLQPRLKEQNRAKQHCTAPCATKTCPLPPYLSLSLSLSLPFASLPVTCPLPPCLSLPLSLS